MASRNYCLFCGDELPDIDTQRGFSGQRGNVDCPSCGMVYNLTVNVLEGQKPDA